MTRLVVNGCSYMVSYAMGDGHIDLARQLNITTATSLAVNGSCNSRIIRTTLKDSYLTDQPTFYIVGLSFLARGEFPINADRDSLEGRWVSTQHAQFPATNNCIPFWTAKDTEKFVELKTKLEAESVEERLEQLMYQLLSMIADLKARGHQILVFRQPEDAYDHCLTTDQFTQLKKCVNIIDGLSWGAIQWQADNGVKFSPNDSKHPVGIRHALPGEHGPINKFLLEYIEKYGLHLPVL